MRDLLRRVSGVDAVLDQVAAAGAEVRYRRVLDAVAELEALAVSEAVSDGEIAGFLARDDTVLARMAAALDFAGSLAESAGLHVGSCAGCGRTPGGGGALAALPARTGQRCAPRLRRGYRQGIVAALVAGRRAVNMTDAAAHDDPVAGVDALVAGIGPRLAPPPINLCDVVLVTGPWLAGVSGVAAALRERLPQHKFVESTDLGHGDAPLAVVFVVSAAAHLTGSDCALLDAAAEHTDVVVCVVAKIDVHHTWRDVLAADREALAAHAPRYAQVPWVGAAAMPELGEVRVDDLVDAVSARLADSDIARRNRLRAWESRLQTVAQTVRSRRRGRRSAGPR